MNLEDITPLWNKLQKDKDYIMPLPWNTENSQIHGIQVEWWLPQAGRGLREWTITNKDA